MQFYMNPSCPAYKTKYTSSEVINMINKKFAFDENFNLHCMLIKLSQNVCLANILPEN